MSESGESEQAEGRKLSVKEMIRKREQTAEKKRSSVNSSSRGVVKSNPRGSRNMSKMFSISLAKTMRASKAAAKISISNSTLEDEPQEEEQQLNLEKFGPNSLQQNMAKSVEIYNRRLGAKKDYVAQQKDLRAEYEQKLKALHESFIEAEKEIIWNFPKFNNPNQKKSDELLNQAKDEKNEKVSAKLKAEAEVILNDGLVEKLSCQTEMEFERLDKMWLQVNVSQWDLLTGRVYNGYKTDVFEKNRKNLDAELFKKKPQEGEIAQWALQLIKHEDENNKYYPQKVDQSLSNLARTALKVAGAEASHENRKKAAKIIKDNPVDGLKKAVKAFVSGGKLDEKILTSLFNEESKLQRNVICRILEVNRESETVRMVMVLDRNGRPCVSGLPKEMKEDNKSYKGTDKIENEGEEEDHIEGYRTVESEEMKAREYVFNLHELLCTDGIIVVDDDFKERYKQCYNNFIPHITYQRVAGFQVENHNLNTTTETTEQPRQRRRKGDAADDAGDFQLVDLGVRLNMEPLLPLEEYDQEWRNGLLSSVKHKTDGPIRFVGYNETGFGFMEDRPIDMHVQKIYAHADDGELTVKGVNIMHMTLYDLNDQISFDTLYLKNDEDMTANKKWKVFGKDAIGNRLAYRVVGQNGEVKSILYPFQGRVKQANLRVKDVSHFNVGDLVNIVTEGQSAIRLARIANIPTGMVLGELNGEAVKSQFAPTPFLEMLRMRMRVLTEMPGLVDLEVITEDGELLKTPREEAWPIECLVKATNDHQAILESLETEKMETLNEAKNEIMSIVEDVKNFLSARSKRAEIGFKQEAESLLTTLISKKDALPPPTTEDDKSIVQIIEESIANLQKNIAAVTRAAAFRRSAKRNNDKLEEPKEEGDV